jgi:hypothetical protein
MASEDIDRWRVWVDEKQTKANEPLSRRRKNMAWDVLNQILEFARVRKLLNEGLLLGMKPFKDSGKANDDDSEISDEPEDADVMPYNADQIEAIIAAARGWGTRPCHALFLYRNPTRRSARSDLGPGLPGS